MDEQTWMELRIAKDDNVDLGGQAREDWLLWVNYQPIRRDHKATLKVGIPAARFTSVQRFTYAA
jgi:hypothetical protein